MRDFIIIGSGPAGITAGIYAARARLDAVILEKAYVSGGQIMNTYEVDNYPGLPGISGMDLAKAFRGHAEKAGVEIQQAEVKGIEVLPDRKIVHTSKGDLETKTVLIATGAGHRKLGIPGEQELTGRGVSYCATCDGNFFRNRTTAVIGGGNVAVEDAIFLSRLCQKVYLVHRRDELRAEKILQESLFDQDNVEIVWNAVPEEIQEENGVAAHLLVKEKTTGQSRTLDVNGVFVAVGIVPDSQAFQGVVDMDEAGYIRAGEDGRTSVPGIYAAGDVRTKALRQIINGAGDGANAVNSCQKDLATGSWK